jgi:predicted dehydrogenase
MIKAAVVGLGRWGRNLVESTQGKTDKIRFTTAVVRTPDKARDFGRAHDLALVTDYAKALADPSIDAVVIATPHTQHGDQMLAALRAGKHAFTDKPFTLTRQSAEAAVKAAADGQRVLAVGFNWRYQPADSASCSTSRATSTGRAPIDSRRSTGVSGPRKVRPEA